MPLFLFTWTSATMPTWLDANVPKPKPRPVTMLPLPRFDAATFGFQPGRKRRTVEHREPAGAGHRRPVDVLPAERDRVHVHRVRELVHDLLAGEELLRSARRPEEVALEGTAVQGLRLREHALRTGAGGHELVQRVLRGDTAARPESPARRPCPTRSLVWSMLLWAWP